MMLAQDLEKNLPHRATAQQVILFKKLAHFINQPNKNNCFVLGGYAGTGKTTCVSLLVKLLPKYGIYTVLLAPTGKAAKVISKYSGKTASTIHRKIYRKASASEPEINFSLAPNNSKDTIYIVDEASMLANEATEWGGGCYKICSGMFIMATITALFLLAIPHNYPQLVLTKVLHYQKTI